MRAFKEHGIQKAQEDFNTKFGLKKMSQTIVGSQVLGQPLMSSSPVPEVNDLKESQVTNDFDNDQDNLPDQDNSNSIHKKYKLKLVDEKSEEDPAVNEEFVDQLKKILEE